MTCGTLAGPIVPRSSLRLPSIHVTLWRLAAGRLEWVLTFSGDVDTPMLEAVLQHVESVTSFVCGTWHLEMLAAGLGPDDERTVTEGLGALVRLDVRHQLVLLPRRTTAGVAQRVLH